MKTDRWAQIAAIYESAIERQPDDRGHFLLEACAGDEDLRREVESLLAQDVSRDGLIERVAADAASMRPLPSANLPCSHNCISATPVTGLVIE